MSESATATAIPREINLGLQKPVATPAYTRRFKSQAQNPEATAGTQATITLDTAQPGSFIDTIESYLSFTLRLTNSNTTRGYNVSFSSCGAHALIRAMRIYVQGVPIEEITEYNALAEWLHDLTGIPDYCDRSAKSRYLANTMMGDHFIYLPPASNVNGSVVDTERDIAIQLPLISGVLGTMAEKMFPSMLVAPGNCYIQLDLASAPNALRIQEINVTSLIVGTGGAEDQSLATLPANIVQGTTYAPSQDPNAATFSSLAAVTSFGEAALNAHLTEKEILDDKPYDAPYIISSDGTVANTTHTGVITTEERIGGGIFGLAIGTSAQLFVGKICADGTDATLGTTTTAAITTNSASSNPNPSVYLGSGLSENGSIQTGSNRKMNTDTINVSYTVRNLEYIGKQVVVGDDVARAIIERAAAGDISIHTQSYRQYPSTISLGSGWRYRVDPSYSPSDVVTPTNGLPLVNMFQRYVAPGAQSIIIPAKISSANAIYHIFRNGQGVEDYQFDSLRRMTIGFRDGTTGGGTTVNAQLRIGNELIPQSPIQSASEALEELLKAHHMDGFYGTCEKMGSIVASSAQYQWPRPGLLTLRNSPSATLFGTNVPPVGRCTGIDTDGLSSSVYGGVQYVRNDYNSQLLCPNPDSVTFVYPSFGAYTTTDAAVIGAGNDFFRPLGLVDAAGNTATTQAAFQFYRTKDGMSIKNQTAVNATAIAVGQGYYAESAAEYADRQTKWKLAVRKAFFGYGDERSDHQIKDAAKANFLNPYRQHTGRYSTFMLGFDLDTFSNNTDTIRSGHYLGNNTVSLNLSNVEFVDNSPCNQALMSNARMDTYVLHDLRLSFQAGGIVQAFY
jgi:hypothetical protein